jgi:hypothetical protein
MGTIKLFTSKKSSGQGTQERHGCCGLAFDESRFLVLDVVGHVVWEGTAFGLGGNGSLILMEIEDPIPALDLS